VTKPSAKKVGRSVRGAGPWFYPDCVSAAPGEIVNIHASSAHGPCHLIVRRIGAQSQTQIEVTEIETAEHPIPADADSVGCDWPLVASFEVGEWRSGYHDLELIDTNGASTHHFICVRAAEQTRARAVVVLNTNTYHSYNYWGGANSYAHVDDLSDGVDGEEARSRAIGRLSTKRPFAQMLIYPPPGAPRVVNPKPRDVGEWAFPVDLDWMGRYQPTPYDGSAGFIDKWEHHFTRWVEDEGFNFDYVTDHDFEADPHLLDGYRAVLLVGHSEYWSAEERRQLDEYVNAGGNLAVLSGNTGYWKIRWEDNGTTLVAHKWKGETDDPLWADPATRSDATHLWSHPAFGQPEAEVTGLSFLYGGYHRVMMCVARGSSAYTVYNDKHWALEGSDLFYGDTFGGDIPLLGYENDGCPIRFDEDGLPAPDGGVGVPADLSIIAMAPATLFEPPESPFPPAIPPEEPEVLASIAYGRTGPGATERLARGHAIMASFTKGQGEVFNAGTTEWVHGLAANDPFVTRITRNVIERFTA